MTPISIDDACPVTEKSKSTLWRLVADGSIRKAGADGKRTMLALEDLRPMFCAPIDDEDFAVMALAAAGNVEAQANIGELFTVAGKHSAAIYWLTKSAEGGSADAMQWLAGAYAAGRGVATDEHLSLMWLAKAAAHGHVIAQDQIRQLRAVR